MLEKQQGTLRKTLRIIKSPIICPIVLGFKCFEAFFISSSLQQLCPFLPQSNLKPQTSKYRGLGFFKASDLGFRACEP